jgi:hypothetical protein
LVSSSNRMSRVEVAAWKASASAVPARMRRGRGRPRPAGESEHDARGDDAARERHRAGGPHRHGDPERGERRDGEVGSGGHAERVRRREGVAGEGLQQDAGDAEGHAHRDAGGEPRHPRTPEDVGVGEHGAARALREVPAGDRDQHDGESDEHADARPHRGLPTLRLHGDGGRRGVGLRGRRRVVEAEGLRHFESTSR